jgi:hypothetical protein
MDIRIKLLKFIGSKKAVSSETIMMEYLENVAEKTIERNHLMTCYRMLGKCGSNRSLPFLRKRIFGGAWTGLIGTKQNHHREGALLALSEIGSTEALKLMNKASKSKSPLIKKAYTIIQSL